MQEFQAGSIVEELKKTLALKAVVLRDGRLTEVEAPMVVPGDILQVEEVCPFVFYFTPIYNILTSGTYRVPLFLLTVALLPKMPSYKSINPLSPVNPLL